MKIITIVGARPNFVKLAPLAKELQKNFKNIIAHTGQHYDIEMSSWFFEQLNLPKPHYNLEVGSGSHAWMTAEIMKRFEPVAQKEKPDAILVYGDTNSALGGALYAAKAQIPLIHVESGMRSHDKIPEEINRKVTDHISDIFFCSTHGSVENLKKEGITKNIYLVGDLMIDAARHNSAIAQKSSNIMERLGIKPKQYILLTIHRAENVFKKRALQSIIAALIESKENIIFPVHPGTIKHLKSYLLYQKLKESNVKMLRPVSYLDMLVLEKNAKKIVTDSGGVQKEAYYFGVPCITLRTVTEWTETVDNGFNKLVGTDKKKILLAIATFAAKKHNSYPYGKGYAAPKIASIIWQWGRRNGL